MTNIIVIIIELEKTNFADSDKPQDCLIEIYSPDLVKKEAVYTQQVWLNKYMRIEGMFTNIIQPFSPFVCWDVSFPARAIIKDGSFWLTQSDEEGLIKVVKYRISTG